MYAKVHIKKIPNILHAFFVVLVFKVKRSALPCFAYFRPIPCVLKHSIPSSTKATPLSYPGAHLRLWISLIAPHGPLHKHHSTLHFSPGVAYCVDSSTPPFLLYHPFVKCEENLLPFTTNKESEALIAKSTLSLPSLFSAPPSFSLATSSAPCAPKRREG